MALRRALIVAGRHDDPQAPVVQRPDRLGRRRLDRIGDGDDAGQPFVDGNEHRRLAFGLQRLGFGRQGRGVDAEIGHHGGVAERDLPARHRAGNALAGDRLEAAGLTDRQAAFAGAADDGLGQRMLRAFFQAGGERQQFVLRKAFGSDDIGQPRPAFGQGAGLVDDQRIDRSEAFERGGFLDQHAGMRPAPGGGHDRHRRRQAERTGTGDDQHRDRRDDGEDQAGLGAEDRPGDKGGERDQHDGRDEVEGDAVGQPLNRRARALRLGDQLDDARKRRLGADLFGAHDQRTVLVERAAGQGIALRLFDRQRLARDHRFVDGRAAFQHDAVDRHGIAGTDAQAVAGLDRIERHIGLGTVRRRSAAPSSAPGRAERGSPSRSFRAPAIRAPGRGTPARR